MNTGLEATLKGVAQNGAREIRGWHNTFAISNETSNTITVGTWDGGGGVSIVDHIPVGTAPFGIDVYPTAGGGRAIVSTSATDGTFTIVVVDGGGALLSNETFPLPTGCTGAQHASLIGTNPLRVAISCGTSGNVAVIDTGLSPG